LDQGKQWDWGVRKLWTVNFSPHLDFVPDFAGGCSASQCISRAGLGVKPQSAAGPVDGQNQTCAPLFQFITASETNEQI